MVRKQYTFSRNHTWNFKIWSFPILATCVITFPGDSGQQQWAELLASPEIMRVNNRHTYIHSVLLQPFWFSLSVCVLSRCCRVWLFVTLWTVAHQAPLSMEFSRQGYCSGLPCPPPGNLPHPGIEPASFMSPSLAGRFFTTSITWETPLSVEYSMNYMRFSTLLYKIDFVLYDFSHL